MSRIKKIVIATGIWPPDIGGPATYAEGFSQRLAELGWKVKIITYATRKSKIKNQNEKLRKFASQTFIEKENTREIYFISKKWPKGIRHLIYFGRVLWAAKGAEVVYALDATAAGAPAAGVAFLLRKKFLIRIGGDLLWERAAESGQFSGPMNDFYESGFYKSFRPFIFRVVRFVLRRARVIFITAENMGEVYEKYYGVKREKIKLLPNVFEGRAGNEENYFRSKSLKTILFAGRFVRYKNLERLIKVLGEVYEKIKPAKLVLIGEGPEREALELKVKSLSLNFTRDISLKDKVEIKETVSREELKRIIAESDLGVALAWTEYNPNFILECLKAGTPVLVSRENGLSVKLPEMFLADPFSDKEIGEKIISILTGPQEAKAVAESLSFSYNWEDSARDLIENL